MWETVTVDREEWARLNEMLELLTELAIVIGAQALKQLPAVLFIESDDDEGIVDIEKLKIKMLFGGKFTRLHHHRITLLYCGHYLGTACNIVHGVLSNRLVVLYKHIILSNL